MRIHQGGTFEIVGGYNGDGSTKRGAGAPGGQGPGGRPRGEGAGAATRRTLRRRRWADRPRGPLGPPAGSPGAVGGMVLASRGAAGKSGQQQCGGRVQTRSAVCIQYRKPCEMVDLLSEQGEGSQNWSKNVGRFSTSCWSALFQSDDGAFKKIFGHRNLFPFRTKQMAIGS